MKVIVNELPDYCGDCLFYHEPYHDEYCILKPYITITEEHYYYSACKDEMIKKRHEDCPLITFQDIMSKTIREEIDENKSGKEIRIIGKFPKNADGFV